MMKIIVIICVFASSVYISRLMSKSLKNRQAKLSAYYRDICQFKDLAIKQSKNVGAIFGILAEQSGYFNETYLYMRKKISSEPNLKISTLFTAAINDYGSDYLDVADTQIISEFSAVLMSLRNVGVNAVMDSYLNDFSRYVKSEKTAISDRVGLINKFGYIVGIFLVIILI